MPKQELQSEQGIIPQGVWDTYIRARMAALALEVERDTTDEKTYEEKRESIKENKKKQRNQKSG